MKHRARKRFGQNFLTDERVIHAIIQAINPKPSQNIVEIGPGQGALTFKLLEAAASCQAIEIDRDLIAYLRESSLRHGQLELIEADALSVDFSQLGQGLRIVGNLPYNISTPLLLHLLSFLEVIDDMHFMLQKEVVERLSASPGSKAWGRLSVLVQYFCEVEYVFTVEPEAFEPMPKVDSAIVRLTPHAHPPYPAIEVSLLQSVLARAFAMRRKTLRNNLKGLIGEDELKALGIDGGRRPETLSIEEFVRIGQSLRN